MTTVIGTCVFAGNAWRRCQAWRGLRWRDRYLPLACPMTDVCTASARLSSGACAAAKRSSRER